MLNSMLLNNQWVTEEIKEDIKNIYLKTNDSENTGPKPMWCNKSNPEGSLLEYNVTLSNKKNLK